MKLYDDRYHSNVEPCLAHPPPKSPRSLLTTNFVSSATPYSIQKRLRTQICPKFVLAIAFEGSSRGRQAFVKHRKFSFFLFDKFLTNSSSHKSLTGTLKNNSPGQILNRFGVRGIFRDRKKGSLRKGSFRLRHLQNL